MKKILNIILLFFCMFPFCGNKEIEHTRNVHKEILDTVYIGGESIGLQITTPVEIMGKYDVIVNDDISKPWENSDIQKGDYIYSLNNYLVTSSSDVANILNTYTEDNIKISVIRNQDYIETNVNVVKNKNGKNSIGLYIKDKITGVGTLTFVNKDTSIYGALGHNVNDAYDSGKLFISSIQGIKKGTSGVPGEKYAVLSDITLGSINKNLPIGIFGEYQNVDSLNKSTIGVMKASDVKEGKAQILTVVSGSQKEYFDIQIEEVLTQQPDSIKGIRFTVTDKTLLEKTGGIIQGMSGSPIIQDGCLVGAVSHVVVSSPEKGYGVFAEWMYYKTIE